MNTPTSIIQQAKNDLPNVDWMPTLTLQRVYEFNPAFSLTAEEEKQYILGVEATLWGEKCERCIPCFLYDLSSRFSLIRSRVDRDA